jgi:hypothetical protein
MAVRGAAGCPFRREYTAGGAGAAARAGRSLSAGASSNPCRYRALALRDAAEAGSPVNQVAGCSMPDF